MPLINESKEIAVLDKQKVTIIPNQSRKQIIPYFEKEEINIILSKIPPNQKGMLFQFLWRTGIRVSEAIHIRKKDIDFNNSEITIRHLKSRKYTYRVIPLHSSLKNPIYMFSAKLNYDDLLFPFCRQYIHKLCKDYGLNHPHKIRHSFAINFLRQSDRPMAIIELKDLLGHSSIKSTLEYLKIVPMNIKKALEKIKFD